MTMQSQDDAGRALVARGPRCKGMAVSNAGER